MQIVWKIALYANEKYEKLFSFFLDFYHIFPTIFEIHYANTFSLISRILRAPDHQYQKAIYHRCDWYGRKNDYHYTYRDISLS